MKHKEIIAMICAVSLASVMVVTVVFGLIGLFDPRVDNNEVFKMITPAFNTIVGAMVGVIAGIQIGNEMIENWQKSFDLVMKSEGGFSDDTRDTGNHMPDGRPGCTNLGVTMITWEMYVERKATIEEMKALTNKDVEPLYKRLFWDRVWGDKMPGGIDYLLFDFAVNAGVGRAVMCYKKL